MSRYLIREPALNIGFALGKFWIALAMTIPRMYYEFKNYRRYYGNKWRRGRFSFRDDWTYLVYLLLLALLVPAAWAAFQGHPELYVWMVGLWFLRVFIMGLLGAWDAYDTDLRMGIHPR